jgi:hypothetical protein
MRLKKLVPMVGFCAVSFLSSSAMGEALWAYHCETQKCLDGTADIVPSKDNAYKVQVSTCDNRQAEKWIQGKPSQFNLKNEYWSTKKGKDQCLDMLNKTTIVYKLCNPNYQAQTWGYGQEGEVRDIRNNYWPTGYGGQCLTVAADNQTVIGEHCGYADGLYPSRQKWKWVSVGTTGKDLCHLKTTNPSKAAPGQIALGQAVQYKSCPQEVVAKPWWYESKPAFSDVKYILVQLVVRNKGSRSMNFSNLPEDTLQLWGIPSMNKKEVYIPKLVFNSAPSGIVVPGAIFSYDLIADLSMAPSYISGIAIRPVDKVYGTMQPSVGKIEKATFECYR